MLRDSKRSSKAAGKPGKPSLPARFRMRYNGYPIGIISELVSAVLAIESLLFQITCGQYPLDVTQHCPDM